MDYIDDAPKIKSYTITKFISKSIVESIYEGHSNDNKYVCEFHVIKCFNKDEKIKIKVNFTRPK